MSKNFIYTYIYKEHIIKPIILLPYLSTKLVYITKQSICKRILTFCQIANIGIYDKKKKKKIAIDIYEHYILTYYKLTFNTFCIIAKKLKIPKY